jgi:hypothetical protein
MKLAQTSTFRVTESRPFTIFINTFSLIYATLSFKRPTPLIFVNFQSFAELRNSSKTVFYQIPLNKGFWSSAVLSDEDKSVFGFFAKKTFFQYSN